MEKIIGFVACSGSIVATQYSILKVDCAAEMFFLEWGFPVNNLFKLFVTFIYDFFPTLSIGCTFDLI